MANNKCIKSHSKYSTLYVARHSWATAAQEHHLPISVISEALGHDSETTTQIYLRSISSSEVDKFNAKMLRELKWTKMDQNEPI